MERDAPRWGRVGVRSQVGPIRRHLTSLKISTV